MIDAYFDAAAKLFTLWPMLALILGITIGLINGALPVRRQHPAIGHPDGFCLRHGPRRRYSIGDRRHGGERHDGSDTVHPTGNSRIGLSPSDRPSRPPAGPARARGLRIERGLHQLSDRRPDRRRRLGAVRTGGTELSHFVRLGGIFCFSSDRYRHRRRGVSTGAMIKGLLGAAFGLAIALIGVDPITGTERLVAVEYLWEGIPLVPAIVGLFAIPEILDLVVSDPPIARKALDLEKVQADIRSQRGEGIRETFRHKFLVLRASLIGLFVGMTPGVGGSVAHWLAYAQARQTEKGAFKTFGTGDIRGVIAPESANILLTPVSSCRRWLLASRAAARCRSFRLPHPARIAAGTGDVEPAFASDFADGMVVGGRQRDRHGGGALLHTATGAHRRDESQCACTDRFGQCCFSRDFRAIARWAISS